MFYSLKPRRHFSCTGILSKKVSRRYLLGLNPQISNTKNSPPTRTAVTQGAWLVMRQRHAVPCASQPTKHTPCHLVKHIGVAMLSINLSSYSCPSKATVLLFESSSTKKQQQAPQHQPPSCCTFDVAYKGLPRATWQS